MKFQKSTGYALRILGYLHNYTSSSSGSGDMPTAQTISEAVGITYPYFIKIANQLKKNGMIGSVQGRNGGYQMAKPACEISVYDVVLAVEGELKISDCLAVDTQCNRSAEHCTMQGYFREVRLLLIDKLSSKKIADLGTV
ncbi:MAG: Rrf2 family transcriptional regulator [Oscillospiraceae bacterium]|nr:Rrf2 family transcriptional regulator [Oscillospiraceae bacterium]